MHLMKITNLCWPSLNYDRSPWKKKTLPLKLWRFPLDYDDDDDVYWCRGVKHSRLTLVKQSDVRGSLATEKRHAELQSETRPFIKFHFTKFHISGEIFQKMKFFLRAIRNVIFPHWKRENGLKGSWLDVLDNFKLKDYKRWLKPTNLEGGGFCENFHDILT